MNFRQIDCFRAVMNTGSMTRAGGVTIFSAARDNVMLCAIVNEVTTTASWRIKSRS